MEENKITDNPTEKSERPEKQKMLKADIVSGFRRKAGVIGVLIRLNKAIKFYPRPLLKEGEKLGKHVEITQEAFDKLNK